MYADDVKICKSVNDVNFFSDFQSLQSWVDFVSYWAANLSLAAEKARFPLTEPKTQALSPEYEVDDQV